jgi:hypothetical protein
MRMAAERYPQNTNDSVVHQNKIIAAIRRGRSIVVEDYRECGWLLYHRQLELRQMHQKRLQSGMNLSVSRKIIRLYCNGHQLFDSFAR